MSTKTKKSKPKAIKTDKPKAAPLPAWMSGDRSGLPMKPPGKEQGK